MSTIHPAPEPTDPKRKKPSKPWSRKKKVGVVGGVLLFGILVGQCGGDTDAPPEPTATQEPTSAPEPPEQTTPAPEPTREPDPVPEPTREALDEVAPDTDTLPTAAGEALLVTFLRGEWPDGTLIDNLTDDQIVTVGREVCARFDAAGPDDNVMMTLALEHMLGDGFVPGYIQGYGTDDQELGSMFGASVAGLCPQHQDRMTEESEAMSGS